MTHCGRIAPSNMFTAVPWAAFVWMLVRSQECAQQQSWVVL